jgi:beta-glucuronidase
MKRKFQTIFIFIACCFFQTSIAQYHIKDPGAISLNGDWMFVLDPADLGVTHQWHKENIAKPGRHDIVTVPHCFSSDSRYEFYTGTAWYRKIFPWKPSAGKRIILHFDAAYYKTNVWLNGKKVGEHEGGYTPFNFDVTSFLKDGANELVVSVNNNTFKTTTIPGMKDHGDPNDSFAAWVNYGGLIRPVYLTIEPEVYAENIKIETLPDLAKNTASIKAKIRVKNSSSQTATPKIDFTVFQDKKPVRLRWKTSSKSIAAGQTALIEAEADIPASEVKLWDIDHPNLYQLKATVGGDTIASRFGIRKIEIKNAQILLNGKPLKAGGGNRVLDYPRLGSLEPDWLIEKDFRLMKEAGMEFHRLTHYTPSEYFYDLADEYGMLIITEAGNWQLTGKQMDNESMRANFKSQFREMAERDWNHPSIMAYSVGNEYLSDEPAGQRWTKDMIAFAKEVDATRLYTFATMRLNALPAKPEDEATQYVDFVCTNTYGGHARSLDHIHKLYPDKPIFISEWGTRSDGKGGEAYQAEHIKEVMTEIRKRPYVTGLAWWTFNDYRSKLFATNVNGFRPWGIVGPDRTPRLAYKVHQEELSPVTIEKTGYQSGDQGSNTIRIKLTARPDFPARKISGYYIKTAHSKIEIPDLNPGESKELDIPIKGFDGQVHISIYKPTGFLALETEYATK